MRNKPSQKFDLGILFAPYPYKKRHQTREADSAMIAQYSQILGTIILVASGVIGGILILAPGSIRLQRPECGWEGWTFNILNLLFFLVLIPLCGAMMLLDIHIPIFICITMPSTPLNIVFESIGLMLFLGGAMLLLWSRLSLRRSFRLAGVKPSQTDYLTLHGPYKNLRHPMYLSALMVLAGLTFILMSILMAMMFIVMLWLIKRLIPREEIQLDQAYPIAYSEYCRRVPGSMFPSRQNHS
jgi:protein-S-isoprenylcysteine O-methyltransferase Ste14